MTKAQRYEGGCHCGHVRFTVRVEHFTALRCNCSICTKKAFLHVLVPASHFSLLKGGEHLTSYRFHTRVADHLFCTTCGVQSFYVPRSHPDGFSVNLRCLDAPAMDEFVIEDFDGAHWEAHIDEIR